MLLFIIFLLLKGPISYAETELIFLKNGDIEAWQSEVFQGETHYQPYSLGDRSVLQAVSRKSASGLFLKKRIDLIKTPYVNWSWLIKKKLPNLDERSKTGDDYAARIYVIIDGGLMAWRTKSINYVWSSSQDVGEFWDNAYVGPKVKMIAVRGKNAKLSHWYKEKQNVYEDLITHFGDKGSDKANQKAYRYIDILALMTDTDNSQSSAETYYSDISFSKN